MGQEWDKGTVLTGGRQKLHQSEEELKERLPHTKWSDSHYQERCIYFFLNCKDPDARSLLQHKKFCSSDLLEMQEQPGRPMIGNSMYHPLSGFLAATPLSVFFGMHSGKKYFTLIVWTSVLAHCTAFQELWDPKHVLFSLNRAPMIYSTSWIFVYACHSIETGTDIWFAFSFS